jgi:hypothetical protein
VRRAANAAEVPDKQPLPPSTSQRVKSASENWFNTSVPVTQPAQPTEPTSGPTETGPTEYRPTKRSKKSNAGQHSSSTEQPGIVVEPNGDPFVILNPPRSNTKGRKKSRIPSGIELQAKKTSLCSACGEPGHNVAICSIALGNK